jgi:hypothetical protein
MSRRVVESLTGVGEIYAGEVLLRSTPYQLSVFQCAEPSADRNAVEIEGHIDITGTLRLEDGRQLQFTLTDTGGKIIGKTGLQPA